MAFVLHLDECPWLHDFSFSIIVEDNSRLEDRNHLNFKFNDRLWWDIVSLIAFSSKCVLPREVDRGNLTNSHES